MAQGQGKGGGIDARDSRHPGKGAIRALGKAVREMPIETRRLFSGAYPDFVLSANSIPLGRVPATVSRPSEGTNP